MTSKTSGVTQRGELLSGEWRVMVEHRLSLQQSPESRI
jgi:hypothetical protein